MALLSCEYFSAARKSAQSFNVILPLDAMPESEEPNRGGGPFKTIYLLHGYSGSRNDWLRYSDIELWTKSYGYAVIMPDGGNSFYLDNEDTEERFGDHIGRELVSLTRQMFPLSHRREDTVIAGLSMGGFGALRSGLKYPETFGAIIALSSALITDEVAAMQPGTGNAIAPYGYYRHTFGDPGKLLGSDKDPKHLAEECVKLGLMPDIFLACGTEDFLYTQNDVYHTYLQAIGYPHQWRTQKGSHDFDFWNKAMPAALEWLTGRIA